MAKPFGYASTPFKVREGEDLYDAGRRALELVPAKPGQQTRALKQIKIGHRIRKDFGNVAALTRSINDRGGLLHPIVITPKNKLIAGERRMRAWALSKFRGDPITVTVIDVDSIVAGEWDENDPTIRKDFTPSEAVAIARELEPRLKAEAKKRQAHGKTARGRKGKVDGAGEAAVKAARATGKSRNTIAKATAIVDAAAADPKKFGKLKENMDRSGRVDASFRRLQIIKQTDAIREAPPGVPMKGPYSVAVIDFPWPNEPDMSQEEIDARARSLRPYPAMSIKKGCAFMAEHVKKILAKDCIVYFWTTNFHVPYAFHLLQALGFRQHSTMGTWRKDKMGRGQVLRDKTEQCIVAIKGKPLINLTNQTTDWSGEGWERRDNSQKPVAFYDLVEELTPASRYAEIFSRGGRNAKWDCHGDEIGKYPPIVPQLPFAEPLTEQSAPPAAELDELLKVSDADVKACRERMKAEFPDGEPGHVVTMSIGGDDNLGTCECGECFVFPRTDKLRNMDIAIERHWRLAREARVADTQLEIPSYLKRTG